MTKVSKLALAALLSLGAVSMGAAPAAAQKKDKDQPAGPALQISPEFRKPAAEAQNAINQKNWAGVETPLAAAEALAKTTDEKYYAAYMRLTYELNQIQAQPGRSFQSIIAPLDELLSNPKTPPEAMKGYNYLRGWAAFETKQRPASIPYFLKARELGSTEADLPLKLAQAYFDAGRINDGIVELGRAIDQEKAAGRKPEESWYNVAVARLYNQGDRPGAATWMLREVADFPTIANWRRVIVLYRDSVNAAKVPLDRSQKIDLFRLMRGTGALADQNDYLEYAQEAVLGGLPWEATAVIEDGRKAGKIPAGDPDATRIGAAAQTAARNEGSLETLAKQAANDKDGKGAGATADAFLASGNYARAIELYDLAIQKGGVDAETMNLRRGEAMVLGGRKDEARAAFALVKTGPNGDIARFWTTWMDLPPLS